MKFTDYRSIDSALDLISHDNDMSRDIDAEIPSHWQTAVQLADRQLAALTSDELSTVATGEHDEAERIIHFRNCHTAELVLASAFDGELSDIIYPEWLYREDASI